MPCSMVVNDIFKKIKRAVKRCRPSKKNTSLIVDGIEATVQLANTIANAASITPFQTATGLALGIIEYCRTMRANRKSSEQLVQETEQLLNILNGAGECGMSDTSRIALQSVIGTLGEVEKDIRSITECGRLRKFVQTKRNAKKIQDCTNRLGVACLVFQVAIGVAIHKEMMRQHTVERRHLDRIEDNVTVLLTDRVGHSIDLTIGAQCRSGLTAISRAVGPAHQHTYSSSVTHCKDQCQGDFNGVLPLCNTRTVCDIPGTICGMAVSFFLTVKVGGGGGGGGDGAPRIAFDTRQNAVQVR
ncbi:hypothetical protein CERSUDRAFT_119039 [Gelatoporia subvermispora B]|uniref:Uncharacterized protein n=1 Tax=Ceriporiopsis subvermispora (strain B) TaxID=914234 RepID=M2P9D2_CERS8|nr:hypothetical protein CERSUDRAFT_119039 [Gelatoporia subvermispora B]